ncbi:PREDICTED: uncharacterized protein LOC108366424 [Rhagoletis zephyria]|uniref:uncharacterized protein LOC108366424 n=1 Tax=Rhagoletis zephyria TaxID=28612 RepID=UPI00081139E5|nr:PREDICTED: uncharacterized protein LOC108366424 [Rhagoletis zephyria]
MVHDYDLTGYKIFYTDASVGGVATGVAIYNYSDKTKQSFKLNFKSSSSFGETLAILKAIQQAKLHNHRKIVIFTDSLVACLLLSKKRTQNYIICAIHKTILEADFDRVTIIWTPSHKGIPGNETADELAKDALNSDDETHVNLTNEQALRSIKNEIYHK